MGFGILSPPMIQSKRKELSENWRVHNDLVCFETKIANQFLRLKSRAVALVKNILTPESFGISALLSLIISLSSVFFGLFCSLIELL